VDSRQTNATHTWNASSHSISYCIFPPVAMDFRPQIRWDEMEEDIGVPIGRSSEGYITIQTERQDSSHARSLHTHLITFAARRPPAVYLSDHPRSWPSGWFN